MNRTIIGLDLPDEAGDIISHLIPGRRRDRQGVAVLIKFGIWVLALAGIIVRILTIKFCPRRRFTDLRRIIIKLRLPGIGRVSAANKLPGSAAKAKNTTKTIASQLLIFIFSPSSPMGISNIEGCSIFFTSTFDIPKIHINHNHCTSTPVTTTPTPPIVNIYFMFYTIFMAEKMSEKVWIYMYIVRRRWIDTETG